MSILRRIEEYFEFDKHKTTLLVEFIAALSTFSSMIYAAVFNPKILAEGGMDFGQGLLATSVSCGIACILMGLYARSLVALGPAIGISAFVVYSVILKKQIDPGVVFFAILLSSVTLFILNMLGLRSKIIRGIPETLVKGATAGIGLFLVVIVLKNLRVIDIGTRIMIDPRMLYAPESVLTIFGVILIKILLRKKVRSAFILVVAINWILALLLGLGEFKGIFGVPDLSNAKFYNPLLHVDKLFSKEFMSIAFSIFLVNLFDSSAGLLALEKIFYPGGELPRIKRVLFPDTISGMIGSFLNTTPLAVHVEAATGYEAGGRTGLTTAFVGLFFLLCLFFYPLAASMPTTAYTPILVYIGLLMAAEMPLSRQLSHVVPGAITMVVMPLTLSVYKGFAIGFVTYVTFKIITRRFQDINAVCWIMTGLFFLDWIV